MKRAITLDGELPEVALVDGGGLGPQDVIVAEVSTNYDPEAYMRLHRMLSRAWPDHRIVICPPDVRLKVVKQA